MRPQGAFLTMEHDLPFNLIVRALFYLRLTFIGPGWTVKSPVLPEMIYVKSQGDLVAGL